MVAVPVSNAAFERKMDISGHLILEIERLNMAVSGLSPVQS